MTRTENGRSECCRFYASRATRCERTRRFHTSSHQSLRYHNTVLAEKRAYRFPPSIPDAFLTIVVKASLEIGTTVQSNVNIRGY